MTFPQAMALVKYWEDQPPEHEIGEIFLRAYTTWKRSGVKTIADLRAEQEAKWTSGEAMNVKQMFEAMGGELKLPGG